MIQKEGRLKIIFAMTSASRAARFPQPIPTPAPLQSAAPSGKRTAKMQMGSEMQSATPLLRVESPPTTSAHGTRRRLSSSGPIDDWVEYRSTMVNRSDRKYVYGFLKVRPLPAFVYTIYGLYFGTDFDETAKTKAQKELHLDIEMAKHRETFLDINGMTYEAAKERFGRKCLEKQLHPDGPDGRICAAANVAYKWFIQPSVLTLIGLGFVFFILSIAIANHQEHKFQQESWEKWFRNRTDSISQSEEERQQQQLEWWKNETRVEKGNESDRFASIAAPPPLPSIGINWPLPINSSCSAINTSQLVFCPRNKTIIYRVSAPDGTGWNDLRISAPIDKNETTSDLLNFFCFCWLTQNEISKSMFCNLKIIESEIWKYSVYLRDDFELFYDQKGLFILHARYRSNIVPRLILRYIAYLLC